MDGFVQVPVRGQLALQVLEVLALLHELLQGIHLLGHPFRSEVFEALELMRRFRISGVPITRGTKLVGILTNRDLRFEGEFDQPIENLMTKENLVTVPVGTTLEQDEFLLHKHRIEKLLVVDDEYNLKGLITVKDIQKKVKYPNAAKDERGRLLKLMQAAAAGVETSPVMDGSGSGASTAPSTTSESRRTREAFRTRNREGR